MVNEAKYFEETLTVKAARLAAGHGYRLWVAACDEKGAILGQTQILFSIRGEGSVAVPSCSPSASSIQTRLGQTYYLTGKVKANGGSLERVTVALVKDSDSSHCYYKTYDAAAILAANGDLTGFDLCNVPPIGTGSVVHADYITPEENALSVDMRSAGSYTVKIWARNAGSESATAVSTRKLELIPRSDSGGVPQIFYFVPRVENGYKSAYYTFDAETSGNVARVELYINGYKIMPEITEENWSGFRFYTLKAMIHTPGEKHVTMYAYAQDGARVEASATVNVMDADYVKLDTPSLTAPSVFEKDNLIHGVAGYSWTASWTQPANADAGKFVVRVWSDAQQRYTLETETIETSLTLPASSIPEVGVYSLSITAVRVGYAQSDTLWQGIRAYSDYTASLQAECPHAHTQKANFRTAYRDVNSTNPAGHYEITLYDLVCLDCAYIVQRGASDDSDYRLCKHVLISDTYCNCGYHVQDATDPAYQSRAVLRVCKRNLLDRRVPRA